MDATQIQNTGGQECVFLEVPNIIPIFVAGY